MDILAFLDKLETQPNSVEFSETMATIEDAYVFNPTAFRNGGIHNDAGQNSGSCKIFAFGRLLGLSPEKTLACFGEYYRKDVLLNPDGSDHANIRNFIETGWSEVEFLGDEPALIPV